MYYFWINYWIIKILILLFNFIILNNIFYAFVYKKYKNYYIFLISKKKFYNVKSKKLMIKFTYNNSHDIKNVPVNRIIIESILI